MELAFVTALGVGGATIIGVLIGFLFQKIPHEFNDVILGFAAGIMFAAAVIGLIIPSLEEGNIWVTLAGILAGAVFLNLTADFIFTACIPVVVGFYRCLFFQVILLFFKKIIDIFPYGAGYFITEIKDCLGAVFCQVIQCTVVCCFRPYEVRVCEVG